MLMNAVISLGHVYILSCTWQLYLKVGVLTIKGVSSFAEQVDAVLPGRWCGSEPHAGTHD